MSATTLTIATRFRGPVRSGNGGYTCGRVAGALLDGGAAGPIAGRSAAGTGRRTTDPPPVLTVTLRRPPPLEAPMTFLPDAEADGLLLLDGDQTVAVATTGEFAGDPVPAVSVRDAGAAESSYRGLQNHPFPTCFVCGTARAPGDGLCLSPGLYAPGRTACVWTPDPSLADTRDGQSVGVEFIWSALDCPGGWSSDLDSRPLVLGRMTATCEGRVRIGRPYVVVGRLVAEQGRKTTTATSLYDEGGRLVARAEHVWIAVDPADFGE